MDTSLEKRVPFKLIDLTGRKINRLLVLMRSDEKGPHGQPKWVVQCDCGTIKNVFGYNLRYNQLQSCGCIVKENAIKRWRQEAIKRRKGLGYSNSRSVYNSKKKDARKKNILFDIPFEEWVKIAGSNCHYCGIEPLQMHNNTHKSEYGKFKFNGLDRVVSNGSYSIGNVVPCCWSCNRAKCCLTQAKFYELIEKIYLNRIVKEKTNIYE